MSFHKHIRRASAGQAVSLWTPENLSQEAMIWLDDTSEMAIDVNGIAQINNKSSNGYHFSQGTNSRKPTLIENELNGYPVVNYDGSNDFLAIPIEGRGLYRNISFAYCFFVTKKTATDGSSTSRRIFSASIPNSVNVRFAIYNDDDSNASTVNKLVLDMRRLDGDTYKYLPSTMPVDNIWVMALGVMDYTNNIARLYVNGELDGETLNVFPSTGSTSNTDSLGIAIGSNTNAGTSWRGQMAALLSGTAISPLEIDKLFGYYAHRYGLTGLLPIAHPYKDNAPTA